MKFPSPHSGILFLCDFGERYTVNVYRFPSPHSGILFLSHLVGTIPSQ